MAIGWDEKSQQPVELGVANGGDTAAAEPFDDRADRIAVADRNGDRVRRQGLYGCHNGLDVTVRAPLRCR